MLNLNIGTSTTRMHLLRTELHLTHLEIQPLLYCRTPGAFPHCFFFFLQRPHFAFFYRPLWGHVSAPAGLPMVLTITAFLFSFFSGEADMAQISEERKIGLISAPNHVIAIFHG